MMDRALRWLASSSGERWFTVFLAALAGGQFALVLLATEWYALVGNAFSLFVCSYVLGWRMHKRYRDKLEQEMAAEFERYVDRLPADVRVTKQGDDLVAFITRQNGDPAILTIPEEVVEGGPLQVREWVMTQLLADE